MIVFEVCDVKWPSWTFLLFIIIIIIALLGG